MVRKNIFEIFNSKFDIDEEINRIKRLVIEDAIVTAVTSFDIEAFVDEYCLHSWRQRGR